VKPFTVSLRHFRALGSGYWLGVPLPVYLMLAILLTGTVLTQYTTWGQEVYATGANTESAALSGFPCSIAASPCMP